MLPRLFHFSDEASIEVFEPRPVRVPSRRPDGLDWLNGPLVWAIDAWHQPMYLFPRDCPRILLWRKPDTCQKDIEQYFLTSTARMIAYVEQCWVPKLEAETLYRYELPASSFLSLQDAGMWVTKATVHPREKVKISDLPGALGEQGVELRVVDALTPLRESWQTSLHVSGIRLRNARGWNAVGNIGEK
jgi:hypothetical protein